MTNHIFGGSYNSRLNTEVRIKKGLTYGASSAFTPHRYTGSLAVETYTRTEATVDATKLVMDLLTGMSQGKISQKELDFARDYLAGVYPIESETAEQVADRVLTVAAFDLPADYNQTYPVEIRATSLEQVQATARKYFSTSDLDIVLVGNVGAFRDAVKKQFAGAEITEIPFAEVDVLSPALRAPKQAASAVAPAATPESLEQGQQILLAAAQAAGGDALQSVATLGFSENGILHDAARRSPARRNLASFLPRPFVRRSEPGPHNDRASLRWDVILAEISGRRSRYQRHDRRIQAR